MKKLIISVAMVVLGYGCVCLGIAKAQAQQFTISGQILNKSKQPIELVSVTAQRGDTIIASTQTDGSGKYSLSYPAGPMLRALTFTSTEFPPNVIRNLSGSQNHSFNLVLVRNSEIARLSPAEASNVATALEFLSQNEQLYSEALNRYSVRLPASSFPTELQTRVLGVQLAVALNRVDIAEAKVSELQENSQRLSGQLDELAAVSNAARGGSKAAQETADAAIGGLNATNDRIADIDNYGSADKWVVPFEEGSATLTSAAKTQLADLSKKIAAKKGYLLVIAGYATSSQDSEQMIQLSQRMAESVARYLTADQGIPVWKIAPPLGYVRRAASGSQQVGSSNHVVITLMISRGLTEPAGKMRVP